jgi:Transglutaminase-like superfamily
VLRRTFTKHTLQMSSALIATKTMAKATIESKNSLATPYLTASGLIQTTHPKIVALANEITIEATSAREAAVLIHNWVRDQILFGLPPRFYETTATESLDAKVGYCNTKVSLFSALLRAKNIPTRIRVVDLSAEVLSGVIDPGTPNVDHSLTEVFLDDQWLQVDSYVVDKPLAEAARKKLVANQRIAGFGIHLNGSTQWNGRTHSFIQCMNDGVIPNYVLKDHGLFSDVNEFYQKVQQARNRLNFLSSLGIRIGVPSINRHIQKIRENVV